MGLIDNNSEGRPRAIIITAPGINCDLELGHAFEEVGCSVSSIHLSELLRTPSRLKNAAFVGMPGGFSYGDAIAAGRIVAHLIRSQLLECFQELLCCGVPIIAPCNGFQVCLQAGLFGEIRVGESYGSLITNSSGSFVDCWSSVFFPKTKCVWTQGFEKLNFDHEVGILPIAHGEGRFVGDREAIDFLEENNRVAVRYSQESNPNGSLREIAGLTDETGFLLGLMPHPERFLRWSSHPWDKALNLSKKDNDPLGLRFFQNAMSYVHGELQIF